MRLEVMIKAYGENWHGGASITVSEPLIYAFLPIETTDEPILTNLGIGLMPNATEFQKTLKFREDVAEEIANALTKLLLAEMAKKDNHNGR